MIYVQYENLNKDSFVGVKKKVLAQCRTFQKAYGEVYYTMYAGQTMYLFQDNTIIDKAHALTKKMCNEAIVKWLLKYNKKRTYIRYPFSDIWFLDFLKELKERNIRSVIEFPTIPYDKEDGIRRPIEDKYYREQLHQYVDCCTTYANYETVFNIPCIPLVNGVDVDGNKIKRQNNEKKDKIILLAVATMRKEHGYERIIKGLHQYYQAGGERKIYFNLVGNGSQINYYKQLVAEYNLEEHVLFYVFLQGKELDDVYNQSDIGVGALGTYKSGIFTGVGIKAAEYCAKGLPMIMVDDYGFEGKYYLKKVPNDETPIDMDGIVKFYDDLQGKEYAVEMHDYAVEKYSWDVVLKPVVEYFRCV